MTWDCSVPNVFVISVVTEADLVTAILLLDPFWSVFL